MANNIDISVSCASLNYSLSPVRSRKDNGEDVMLHPACNRDLAPSTPFTETLYDGDAPSLRRTSSSLGGSLGSLSPLSKCESSLSIITTTEPNASNTRHAVSGQCNSIVLPSNKNIEKTNYSTNAIDVAVFSANRNLDADFERISNEPNGKQLYSYSGGQSHLYYNNDYVYSSSDYAHRHCTSHVTNKTKVLSWTNSQSNSLSSFASSSSSASFLSNQDSEFVLPPFSTIRKDNTTEIVDINLNSCENPVKTKTTTGDETEVCSDYLDPSAVTLPSTLPTSQFAVKEVDCINIARKTNEEEVGDRNIQRFEAKDLDFIYQKTDEVEGERQCCRKVEENLAHATRQLRFVENLLAERSDPNTEVNQLNKPSEFDAKVKLSSKHLPSPPIGAHHIVDPLPDDGFHADLSKPIIKNYVEKLRQLESNLIKTSERANTAEEKLLEMETEKEFLLRECNSLKEKYSLCQGREEELQKELREIRLSSLKNRQSLESRHRDNVTEIRRLLNDETLRSESLEECLRIEIEGSQRMVYEQELKDLVQYQEELNNKLEEKEIEVKHLQLVNSEYESEWKKQFVCKNENRQLKLALKHEKDLVSTLQQTIKNVKYQYSTVQKELTETTHQLSQLKEEQDEQVCQIQRNLEMDIHSLQQQLQETKKEKDTNDLCYKETIEILEKDVETLQTDCKKFQKLLRQRERQMMEEIDSLCNRLEEFENNNITIINARVEEKETQLREEIDSLIELRANEKFHSLRSKYENQIVKLKNHLQHNLSFRQIKKGDKNHQLKTLIQHEVSRIVAQMTVQSGNSSLIQTDELINPSTSDPIRPSIQGCVIQKSQHTSRHIQHLNSKYCHRSNTPPQFYAERSNTDVRTSSYDPSKPNQGKLKQHIKPFISIESEDLLQDPVLQFVSYSDNHYNDSHQRSVSEHGIRHRQHQRVASSKSPTIQSYYGSANPSYD